MQFLEKTNGFWDFFLQRALQVMLLGCITSKPKNPQNPKNHWFKPMVFHANPGVKQTAICDEFSAVCRIWTQVGEVDAVVPKADLINYTY